MPKEIYLTSTEVTTKVFKAKLAKGFEHISLDDTDIEYTDGGEIVFNGEVIGGLEQVAEHYGGFVDGEWDGGSRIDPDKIMKEYLAPSLRDKIVSILEITDCSAWDGVDFDFGTLSGGESVWFNVEEYCNDPGVSLSEIYEDSEIGEYEDILDDACTYEMIADAVIRFLEAVKNGR